MSEAARNSQVPAWKRVHEVEIALLGLTEHYRTERLRVRPEIPFLASFEQEGWVEDSSTCLGWGRVDRGRPGARPRDAQEALRGRRVGTRGPGRAVSGLTGCSGLLPESRLAGSPREFRPPRATGVQTWEPQGFPYVPQGGASSGGRHPRNRSDIRIG